MPKNKLTSDLLKNQLKIEQWPIDRLIPYCRNPRRNDAVVDKMVSAIKEFGFRIPIVAKSDGSVIDGHLRLKAAQKLGMKEIPVALADELTDAQIKAFRLLANRSVEWAEWDNDLLKLELQELQEVNFDLELTGFNLDELELLIEENSLLENKVSVNMDLVPDINNHDVISQYGDVWILGKHRLACGDNSDSSLLSLLIRNCKIDAILTDPPYGLGDSKTSKNNYDSYQDTPENLKKLIIDAFPNFQKISKVVVLTPGNKNHWLYPRPDWEMAWFCPAGTGRGPWGFCCWQPILCYGKDPKLAKGLGSHPDAIVHTESVEIKWHPCAKPIKFWEWLLCRITEEKNTVFDPFVGSGTTLIACENNNRICYAMELSPYYVDMTIIRWQKLTGLQAVHEASGKYFDDLK